jgi:hypothetical protein
MSDARLRDLLLRRLPASTAERLEDAVVLEDGFAERLREEEFDLLDDYAAGLLSEADRTAVERHLLNTAQRRHSLRVARALRRQGPHADSKLAHAAASQSLSRPAGHFGWRARSAALAGLAAAVVASLALFPLRRYTVPGLRSAPNEAAPLAKTPADRSLPIVTLIADVNRGILTPVVAIPLAAGTQSVRLQAEVPDPQPGSRYTLRVMDAEGHRLFQQTALPVQSAGRYAFVEALLPAGVLGPDIRGVSLTSSAPGDAPALFTWSVRSTLH